MNQVKINSANRKQHVLLYLLLLVNTFQYSFWGCQEPLYGKLRIITIILLVLLFASCLFSRKSLLKNIICIPVIKIFFWCLIFFTLPSVILLSLGASISFSSHRDIFITLIIIVIGSNIEFTAKSYKNFLSVYILAGAICASSFISFLGFKIPEYYFIGLYKNQLTPFFSILSIITFNFLLKDKKKLLYILLLGVYLSVIAILRGRAALLSLTITFILYIWISPKISIYLKLLLIAIPAIYFAFNPKIIYEIFVAGKDIADINSVSSGRIERIHDGLMFLNDNLLKGSLWYPQYNGDIVHVYILKRIIDFGLLLATPIIILYFYIFISGTKDAVSQHSTDNLRHAPLAIFFLFLVSLNEYSYPFSPVSSTMLAYLTYGVFLRTKYNKF